MEKDLFLEKLHNTQGYIVYHKALFVREKNFSAQGYMNNLCSKIK